MNCASLVGAGFCGALLVSTAASATPVFTINPNAIPSIAGYSQQAESDINAATDSLIQQTGATTQVEYGWALVQSFTDNGAGSTHKQTGVLGEDNSGTAVNPDAYGLYITFQVKVTGITGFGAGNSGTIAPGDFNFALYADVGDDDIFSAGAVNSLAGVKPSVTDTGANDILLAVGTSLTAGNAGFQSGTGAPTLSGASNIILCDGTANQGVSNGAQVAAAGCGTFDARTYFVTPDPFYDFLSISVTAGSAQNLTFSGAAATANATLNGVVADLNFNASVPEPISISLLGAGLLGAAFYRRRKPASA